MYVRYNIFNYIEVKGGRLMEDKDTKSKYITVIIIISLLLNLYLIWNNYSNHRLIIQEYKHELDTAKMNLYDAYYNISYITSIDYDKKTLKKLYRLQNNLYSAQEHLYYFGRYFNYTREASTTGFKEGSDYLDAYINTVEEWIQAVENKDIENVPTIAELVIFQKDIKNTMDKLDDKRIKKIEKTVIFFYGIYGLTGDELRTIFKDLRKETKSKRVSYYFSRYR